MDDDYIQMAVPIATSDSYSANIDEQRMRLFEYFETFGDIPVHNKVCEIADIINERVEVCSNYYETYLGIEYTVGFCKVIIKGLDTDLCNEQC